MPYLRVGMHLRNLEIMARMDKDRRKEDKIKADLEQRQQARLKTMGVG